MKYLCKNGIYYKKQTNCSPNNEPTNNKTKPLWSYYRPIVLKNKSVDHNLFISCIDQIEFYDSKQSLLLVCEKHIMTITLSTNMKIPTIFDIAFSYASDDTSPKDEVDRI